MEDHILATSLTKILAQHGMISEENKTLILCILQAQRQSQTPPALPSCMPNANLITDIIAVVGRCPKTRERIPSIVHLLVKHSVISSEDGHFINRILENEHYRHTAPSLPAWVPRATLLMDISNLVQNGGERSIQEDEDLPGASKFEGPCQASGSASAGEDAPSDPSLDVKTPSESQNIRLLDMARKHYKGDKLPPFVKRNTNETTRPVVVPTKDGIRPLNPTTTELIREDWDAKSGFWTLTVNGKREIVAASKGGPQGGARYRAWQGVFGGIDDNWSQPLVLSAIRSSSGQVSEEWEHSPPTSMKGTPYGIRQTCQGTPGTSDVDERLSSSDRPQERVHVLPQDTPAPAESTCSALSIITSCIVQKFTNGLLGRIILDKRPVQRPPIDTAKASQAASLPREKLMRTYLIIPRPHTECRIAVPLRYCTTTSSLFDLVARMFHLPEDSITHFDLTFTWLPDSDENRQITVIRHTQDPMATVLEVVNKASCWEEGNGCTILAEPRIWEGELTSSGS